MAVRIPRAEAAQWLIPKLDHLRAQKPAGQALVVGIGAPSAAGKGHLVDEMARTFGRGACVLGLDPYYRGVKWMKRHEVTSFDDPAALDLDLAAEHLDRLRRHEDVQMPIYDFPSGERKGYEPFASADIVIVEGLFALRPPILEKLDFKIFIETDWHGALLRRLFRDAGPTGRTKQSAREIVSQFFGQVLPSKRQFIDPTYAQADAIVESRYDPIQEACRAGAKEHQLKRRCHGEQPAFDRLGLSATRFWAGWQEDRFLAPPEGKTDGETIRLRREDGVWTFTYKGPMTHEDGSRVRDVFETEIAAEDAARFRAEYREIGTLRKHRTLYQWDDCGFAYDRVEGLGEFVEVRALTEEVLRHLDGRIREAAPQRFSDPIPSSYLEMILPTRT
jgi:uridine kinase